MGDGQDNYVHLGERDCSVQRPSLLASLNAFSKSSAFFTIRIPLPPPPLAALITMMGDKITARQTVHHAGVPVIPGSNDAVNHVSEIEKLAKDIGYPVAIISIVFLVGPINAMPCSSTI
jgi:biotin carboxylase